MGGFRVQGLKAWGVRSQGPDKLRNRSPGNEVSTKSCFFCPFIPRLTQRARDAMARKSS